MTTPTLDTLMQVSGGKLSRDGQSVVVSYGPLGYLRLTPDTVGLGTPDNPERPAVHIAGRLVKANGARQAELRERFRGAGIEIR